MMRSLVLFPVAACLAWSPAALADEPSIVHTAPGTTPSDQRLVLEVELMHPELVRRADVHWRTGAQGAFRTARVRRSASLPRWAAEVPRPGPQVDRIEYWITVQDRSGRTRDAFASERAPHVVVVRPTPDDAQELTDLAHHGGRRLDLEAGAEWIDLGRRPDANGEVCGEPGGDCRDDWYGLSGAVRYHFLRRVRSVGVRVERLHGVTIEDGGGAPQAVGLVAATADVELRLRPAISMFLLGIIGADERSVQPGGGVAVAFGVGEPTRLHLGVRGVLDVGWVVEGWLRWLTLPRTPLGAGIEVTSFPGASSEAAVRLLCEVGRELGQHLTITVRGGYGARDLHAGGPSLGLVTRVSF